MLFLYRPGQTRLPYVPRSVSEQDLYNRRLHETFDATRRIPPYAPSESPERTDPLAALAELHDAGILSDAEFDAAKTRLIAPSGPPHDL
jgi:hypothetical protein